MATQNGSMNGEIKDSLVVGETSQGGALHAKLLRLTKFAAVFEVYSPELVIRTSEALANFKILHQDRTIYSGRAVVCNLIHAGVMLVCEVSLEEGGWMDVNPVLAPGQLGSIQQDYQTFLREWQKLYRVSSDFKVVVADMQTFLTDLRLWLNQLELGIRSSPSLNRSELEQEVARELGNSVVPTFDEIHERLEILSEGIEEELRPAHQNYLRRQLHPLVLCSPFAHRTYHKPLGYAGDYEMINMLARDPFEGSSLYAKVLNCWFVSQWPAKAHRNRLEYLAERLDEEARHAATQQRRLKVLNFACGPAAETQKFLKESQLSNQVDMTLLDFNPETLQHTQKVLENIREQFGRGMGINFIKKSVNQVLKESSKPVVNNGDSQKGKFKLIYCAGLLDYLSDRTSKQLVQVLYQQLEPGGVLAITTVDDYKPFRNMLEFVLDWHLIYRDGTKAANLIPEIIAPDSIRVLKDTTGVNVFVELRKPMHV